MLNLIYNVMKLPAGRGGAERNSIWDQCGRTKTRSFTVRPRLMWTGRSPRRKDQRVARRVDRWDQEGVEFLFGADSSQGLVGRAEGLEPSAWSRLDRAKKKKLRRRRRKNIRQALVKKNGYRNLQLEREDVAELAYRPAACKQNYRLVVVRKQITVTQGQGRLFDETRYLFYLTNLRKESAREVVFSANRRCHQENVVEQLKNGVQAMHALGQPRVQLGTW